MSKAGSLSLAAGAVAGAIGGGVAVTVLAPLTAANNFIGSFFFGDGMIIGERKAYQNDWPKIKKRLDNGESFLHILEEYTIDNTTAVMSSARQIIEVVKPIWFEMVKDYLRSIPQDLMQSITDMINVFPEGQNSLGKAAANATIDTFSGGLIPEAFAEEQITDQKFVTDYIQEAKNLPFNLLADIVEKMLSGKLGDPIERRIAYIQVYKEILANKKKSDTAAEAILKSTNEGIVRTIATMFNSITKLLSTYGVLSRRKQTQPTAIAKRKLMSAALSAMKKYNQFVQVNKRAKLTIDTAKSLAAFKPVPK